MLQTEFRYMIEGFADGNRANRAKSKREGAADHWGKKVSEIFDRLEKFGIYFKAKRNVMRKKSAKQVR